MQRINNGRKRILIPAGIGDVYWTLVKFEAFCRSKGIEDPYVAIITTEPEARYAGSELRALEFLRMVPFVKLDDPPNREAYPTGDEWLKDIYYEMWYKDRRVVEGFMGYDYFLVYNGAITNGQFLEEVDDLECNWHFPLLVTEEQTSFQQQIRQQYGPYVVYLWPFCDGSYSKWHVAEFDEKQITESIVQFTKTTGLTPVFIGAWWDKSFDDGHLIKYILENVPGSVDLLGKTTLHQLFGLIKGCEIFIGCQCGPAIMAGVFGKKVLTLWSKKYPLFGFPNSHYVMVPPEARGTTWRTMWVDGLTVEAFVDKSIELLHFAPGVA